MKRTFKTLCLWAALCGVFAASSCQAKPLGHDHWYHVGTSSTDSRIRPINQWLNSIAPAIQSDIGKSSASVVSPPARKTTGCPAEENHVLASVKPAAFSYSVAFPENEQPPRPNLVRRVAEAGSLKSIPKHSGRFAAEFPYGCPHFDEPCIVVPPSQVAKNSSADGEGWLARISSVAKASVSEPAPYSADDYQVYDYPAFLGGHPTWDGRVSQVPRKSIVEVDAAKSNSVVLLQNSAIALYRDVKGQVFRLGQSLSTWPEFFWSERPMISSAAAKAQERASLPRPKFAYDHWFAWRGLEPVGDSFALIVRMHFDRILEQPIVQNPSGELQQAGRFIEMQLCGTSLLNDWYALETAWNETRTFGDLSREEVAQVNSKEMVVATAIWLDQAAQRLSDTADWLLETASSDDPVLAERWESRRRQAR